MNAFKQLLAVYTALALVPIGPPLLLSWSGAPWQGIALAGAWSLCWYAWLGSRLRRKA